MTRRLSDLLVVYVLAREAGLLRIFPEGIVCLLPVVPLFETADDLEAGPDYASLVGDAPLREKISGISLAEWNLTRAMIDRLRGGAMAARRPRMSKTLNLRAEALRILHIQQIALLRRWRGLRTAGMKMAPRRCCRICC